MLHQSCSAFYTCTLHEHVRVTCHTYAYSRPSDFSPNGLNFQV